jgi:2-polyprenyl-3-methyl-5-hydroxy-6-metoxy-1,4-benzoquinol methylase
MGDNKFVAICPGFYYEILTMGQQPTLEKEIIDYISSKRPLQAKKIRANFASSPGLFQELKAFLVTYSPYLLANSISALDLAEAYVSMVDQMTCARIAFLRKGVYPAANHSEVVDSVYAAPAVMKKYMLGLALSQFLWKHHFHLFSFYREELAKIPPVRAALEVGCGHGLFLLELLRSNHSLDRVDVVDISAQSLALSQSLISTLRSDVMDRIRFTNMDVQLFKPEKKFDLITMGEVLEHVPDPLSILRSLYGCLQPLGRMYISTCINCPTLDHIYQFRSVNEIHDLIHDAGFELESEVISPSEDRPAKELERLKVDISYGAFLRKKKA